MPTDYSPWMASNRVRFVYVWTTTKTNTNTTCTVELTVRLQTRYSLYDSVNNWSISGGMGSRSGSTNISHGNSGGTTTLFSITRTGLTADPTFTVRMEAIEAYGTFSHSYTIDVGTFARQIGDFRLDNVTASSFRAFPLESNGEGSGIRTQVQYNTTASATGASTRSVDGWAAVTVTGLSQNRIYHARMRAYNTQTGWGPWTSWKSTRTLPAPRLITNFTASQIEQTTFLADVVSTNGIGTPDRTQVQYNTSMSATGAQTRSVSGMADIPVTGLNPQTTYYYRMRISTIEYGDYGPWTAWKSFTTLPGIFVRHNGVWRPAILYVRHNGAWKMARLYVRHNGVWRG